MAKIRGVKPDYWTDEDIVELSIPARLLFIGMWNFACDNGHLQDKPKQIKMRILPADDVDIDSLLAELVDSRRIDRAGGIIVIPKFSFHQRPHKRWWTTCDLPWCVVPDGGSQPLHNGGSPVDHGSPRVNNSRSDGDGDGDGDKSEIADAIPDEPNRPEVETLCSQLADRIEANGSKRPDIGKSWINAVRLMLDRDKRTEEQIAWLIDWCQKDEFWKSNILSMPKFREKFDQMRLKATSDKSNVQPIRQSQDPSTSWMRRRPGDSQWG